MSGKGIESHDKWLDRICDRLVGLTIFVCGAVAGTWVQDSSTYPGWQTALMWLVGLALYLLVAIPLSAWWRWRALRRRGPGR